MSKNTRILIGALAALTIVGCVILAVVWLTNRGGEEAPADPLAGTKWQAQSLALGEGGSLVPLLADTQLTAEFGAVASPEQSIVSGLAGCNRYTAGYTVDGDSLSIAQPASTMMFCEGPEGVMDQEALFLSAMQSASSFKLKADQLRILDAQGNVVAEFVPYQPQAEMTEPPPAADDSWNRVEAAGKMVVGTSADYPPFAFFVGEGQIDGFDIALMDEIGRRLSVAIEYQDLAFDGLGPALVQRQIDAAIGAISRTPEREALVYFSNVYLVAEDGVLAREDSAITIGSADDLVAYRVGVQRNTFYQDWMQRTLVDTGRMSPDNLFAYEKAEHLVRDLRDARVDLAILDAQAAQAFVEQDGFKLIAKGQGQQHYAIALPKGAAALQAKLNEAITGMYNDGTIAGLAQRYLGVPQVLPTPTPAPVPTSAPGTPSPQPPCTDGLALVQHLTQDGEMKPGQAFSKGWRVQNTGTCTWSRDYRLIFASGDRMGGQPVAVSREVRPGETHDVYVDLVAPVRPGSHQGQWHMVNGQGTAFGQRLRVSITVPAAPTVTPAPTQTPVAGISFTVDRTNIRAGECVVFRWRVDNVQAVFFYQEGQRWQDRGVTGQETRTECPPATTTYVLRVVKRDNTVDERRITIFVQPAPQAPTITRFTVDPQGQITLGQCVTVRWQVEGQIDSVRVTANGQALWDPGPTTGNTQHCPAQVGSVAYAIEVVGPGGTSRGQQTVNVVAPATATPVPTPAPEQPVIHSFSVSPNQIPAGECVSINWSAGGGTSFTRILRNGAVIVDGAGFSGQQQNCLDEVGSYGYRFEAYNPAGQMVFQEAGVTVTQAPEPNPLAGTGWAVTAFAAGPDLATPLPGTSLTMLFSPEGQVSGSSGCNTYRASYTVAGAFLAITPPLGTSILCEPEVMEQETAFLAALVSAGSFEIQGSNLYVADASGTRVLECVRIAR
jgi:polar amino acid transport system substrate-binding protein